MDSANQGQSVRPSVEKLPKSCKKVIDENCKGCEENPIDFPCSIHDCKMIEKMRERLDALEKTESIRRDRFVEMTNQLNPMEYLIKEINEKVAALEANKVNREVFELDIGGLGNEVKKLEEWKQKWETPETDHLEPKGINFILEAHLKRITELERQSTELKKETMYNEKESLKDYIWNRLNHVKLDDKKLFLNRIERITLCNMKHEIENREVVRKLLEHSIEYTNKQFKVLDLSDSVVEIMEWANETRRGLLSELNGMDEKPAPKGYPTDGKINGIRDIEWLLSEGKIDINELKELIERFNKDD